MKIEAKKLTLTEKVGQMFLVGLDGTEAEGDIIELIQTHKIGGILLRKINLENIEQMQKLINDLKAANLGNSVPLFIAISQEIGRGNNLPKSIRKLPAIKFVSENSDKVNVIQTQQVMANLLKNLGINMNFSPLLDMGGMKDGVPLGDRCISFTNPTVTATFGAQAIEVYKNNGIIPVPKHFPGYTSTKGDRDDIIIPYTKKSLSKLEQFDLVPFKYVIDEGAETMLVGNIHLSKFNLFTPATMSSKITTKLLRGRYKFNGVAIADDLCSTCVKVQYGIKDAVRKSIIAGNDIVIISDAAKAKSAILDIENQIEKGNIDEKIIDLRVQRILDLKDRYSINDIEVAPVKLDEENEAIEELIEKINGN